MYFRFHIIMLACVLLVSCSTDEPVEVNVDVVINELMPSNSTTAADQDGEYDDWIELYNRSQQEADLSGYFMTDNDNNLTRWRFPEGTVIAAQGYLILWADGDLDQEGLHADFALSADGEELLLVTPDMDIADRVEFDAQDSDLSFARSSNGTGDFSWGSPTFNAAN